MQVLNQDPFSDSISKFCLLLLLLLLLMFIVEIPIGSCLDEARLDRKMAAVSALEMEASEEKRSVLE